VVNALIMLDILAPQSVPTSVVGLLGLRLC
jgi:hypothetical protein